MVRWKLIAQNLQLHCPLKCLNAIHNTTTINAIVPFNVYSFLYCLSGSYRMNLTKCCYTCFE